jgi:hypothetical protein
MPPRRDDQTAHELNIATLFLDHLARDEGLAATDLRSGNAAAGEPDNVCTVGGAERGIELVDCWLSGEVAKVVWQAAREAQHMDKRGPIESTSNVPDDTIAPHPSGNQLAAVAEQRMRETRKAYGMPTWLILNASQTIAPLEDSRSGPWLASQIRKPPRCPFADVYLCLAPASSEDPRRFFRIP